MKSIRSHSYAASIGSDLAAELIEKFGKKKGIFLDIFAGSGTTLTEALNYGMYTYGIDVDPIACLICRTQTRKYTKKWLKSFELEVLESLENIRREIISNIYIAINNPKGEWFRVNGYKTKIPVRNDIDYWFTANQSLVLACLTGLLQSLKSKQKRELLALTISSSIIRKWPNTISMAMDIDHSRPHKRLPVDDGIDRYFYLFKRTLKKNIQLLKDEPLQ